MPYLRNVWYAAAWSDELGEGLLARRLLDTPVVLYRAKDGRPVALDDRCPHRFAPLSLGRRVDDGIECGYHGLRFDCQGACSFNPHGDGRIPPRAQVRSYPMTDRHTLAWIWMGDPALADPARIPELDFLDDPQFQNVRGYTLANGHYELMTDNIMDLGHIEFLHAGLLGSDAVRKAASEVFQNGDDVHSHRTTRHEILPPFLQVWYEAGARPSSRWLNVRWSPAAAMKLTIGVLPEGDPRETARESQGCHLMTPESETSTHYFWAQGRNWGERDPAMDAGRLASMRKAFDEQDKPMIEAVQRNMGTTDLESLQPVMLATDGGPVRARRVLKELIARERAAAPASPLPHPESR